MCQRNISKIVGVILFFQLALCAHAQITAISYQGRLIDNNVAPTTSYQMQFSIWDSPSSGTQIGSTLTNPAVAVTDGIFTVQLDFGSAPFNG